MEQTFNHGAGRGQLFQRSRNALGIQTHASRQTCRRSGAWHHDKRLVGTSSLIFGTPVIGYRTAEGNYLENSQLEPDIYVLNSPEDAANSLDAQLKAAVDELLRELDAKK